MKVSIVGLGLIGGSLGRALKAYNLKSKTKKYEVLGIAKTKDVLKTALKMQAADKTSLSFMDLSDSDIVVIAVPVDKTVELYKQISGIVKEGAIISDVGSIKFSIEKEISRLNKNKKYAAFVGAHPMSGKETNGLINSEADLFKGANVVITGSVAKSIGNENIIAQMWRDAGARIIKIPSKKHDELVALTSHLPHLSAFALNKIYKQKRSKDKQIDAILAGSFYSAIRVASSSADMWAPIFEDNKANVLKNLRAFIAALKEFEKNLGSKEKMKELILKTQR